MSPLALVLLGLVLGLRHAMDPDHVVAVAAITARTRRVLAATWLGVVWGMGHTLTLFAVGAAIILFKLVIPARLGLGFELCVAVALVVVGIINLGRPPALAMLVLAAVRDPLWACGYLVVFGLGTLLGMALITTGIASPLALAGRRWSAAPRRIRVATGLLSLAFGAWLIVQIGWHDGLFLAVPHWEPH